MRCADMFHASEAILHALGAVTSIRGLHALTRHTLSQNTRLSARSRRRRLHVRHSSGVSRHPARSQLWALPLRLSPLGTVGGGTLQRKHELSRPHMLSALSGSSAQAWAYPGRRPKLEVLGATVFPERLVRARRWIGFSFAGFPHIGVWHA